MTVQESISEMPLDELGDVAGGWTWSCASAERDTAAVGAVLGGLGGTAGMPGAGTLVGAAVGGFFGYLLGALVLRPVCKVAGALDR